MNDADGRLFPKVSGFSEADYLTFLSGHVPKDIPDQLTHDAHPDLWLDPYVEVADLTRPLLWRSFPLDCRSRSTAIFRLAGVLEHTVLGYFLFGKEDDPYKQIYVASYYLYVCLHGVKRCRHYTEALVVLARAASRGGFEGRLHVCRFIGSLVPLLETASVADPTPMSSALTALSTILGGIVDDVSAVAERALREDEFIRAWRKEEEDYGKDAPWVTAVESLKQLVSDMFGQSGKLRLVADRFRELWEEEQT